MSSEVTIIKAIRKFCVQYSFTKLSHSETRIILNVTEHTSRAVLFDVTSCVTILSPLHLLQAQIHDKIDLQPGNIQAFEEPHCFQRKNENIFRRRTTLLREHKQIFLLS